VSVKEKMNLAMQLLNEVIAEVSQMNDTNTNKQIAGLIRTFGRDTFIAGIETMQAWVNDLEID
jgi:hypothetical protein